MKLTKKLKSNKGFTLVELVVVIAVLAILAGVGSVAYSGYITKAKDAADVSLLSAIKTAADATAAASEGHFAVKTVTVTCSDGKGTISQIKIDPVDGTATAITITHDSSGWSDANFSTFYGSNAVKFESDTYAKGAVCDGNGWKAAE